MRSKKRVTPGGIHQVNTNQRLNTTKQIINVKKGDVGLNCLYSNVDQLLNKMDDLLMLIASDEPDIMMLTEVIPKAQINPTLETQISIKGYEIFTNFNYTDTNLGSSGIRGVAIYVKENLICREIKFRGIFEDHVWVEISLKNKDALLCGCIYRSPTDDKLSTIESTAKVCKLINESVKRMNSHLIICGDFNYPRIDWESEFVDEKSSVITPFIDTIQSCYLYQHVFQPTRFREGNEPGLLDLIFRFSSSCLHHQGLFIRKRSFCKRFHTLLIVGYAFIFNYLFSFIHFQQLETFFIPCFLFTISSW